MDKNQPEPIVLEIGAGPKSDAKYQIDVTQFPKTTHVLDVALEPLPFEDNFFDEVWCSQVIEHIPVLIYYGGPELKDLKKRYARVELMKEIYRVLKPGGILAVSTPVKFPYWAQDPTHVDVPFLGDTMEYFCGGWGANKSGDFAKDTYGIDFAFQWVKREPDGFNEILIVKKPDYIKEPAE